MYGTLPDAIRYVNPSWDFLGYFPRGGGSKRLWPFFFYWLGLAEPGAAIDERSQVSTNTDLEVKIVD